MKKTKNVDNGIALWFSCACENPVSNSPSGLPAECHSLNVKNASGESKFLFPVCFSEQAGTCAFCSAGWMHPTWIAEITTRTSKENHSYESIKTTTSSLTIPTELAKITSAKPWMQRRCLGTCAGRRLLTPKLAPPLWSPRKPASPAFPSSRSS